MDRYRLIIGGTILIGLLLLAAAIALGHVEEKTSYGMMGVLSILGKVALDFSEWAFRREVKDEKDAPVESAQPAVGHDEKL